MLEIGVYSLTSFEKVIIIQSDELKVRSVYEYKLKKKDSY